mgnify:CR=1 FL=1
MILRSLLFNLLFPPKCIFCDTLLPVQTKLDICFDCYDKIPFLCKKLYGTTDLDVFTSYCDEVLCVCEYSGMIKEALTRYKIHNNPGYHRT